MEFSVRLRELREGVGLSESKLADASGVSFAAIHEYGLGRRKPSFDAVVKIARALGVTCEAFAGCVDGVPEAEAKKPASGRPKKAPPNAVDKPVKGKKGKGK